MEKYIRVVAVCPFLNGKPCINDGFTREVLSGRGIAHPCMYWDNNVSSDDEEPCLIMRAVKKTLGIVKSDITCTKVEVPFE